MKDQAGVAWVPCELHTHTFHSDGKQTLRELAQSARELGFECIALTDHNTMTGLLARDEVQQETGLQIIRGMEWTTFYGHMLTLGYDLEQYVDWRVMGQGDIHQGIDQVHRLGGIVGVAHPFRMGSPICTGCFWEFEVARWQDVDYFEVWSGTFPSIKNDNARAFARWTELLNEGYRLTAVSGRDWHVSAPVAEPVSVTYLGVQPERFHGDFEERAMQALARGSASITLGPLLLLSVYSLGGSGPRAGIGDTLTWDTTSKEIEAHVTIDVRTRSAQWSLPEQALRVKLVSNLGVISEVLLPVGEGECSAKMYADGLTWLRAELYGCISGVNTMIAFTNPVFLCQRNRSQV